MAAAVAAGEYLEMNVNGNAFTQAFSTDETTTMTLLADKINQGTDDLTATRSAAKVITLTSTENGKAWTTGGMSEFTATVPINETAATAVPQKMVQLLRKWVRLLWQQQLQLTSTLKWKSTARLTSRLWH